jgi:signal transduction histidine kinase
VTKEHALIQLRSSSAHARLQAARFLARNAELIDLPELRSARASESDFYVRGSLDRAIDRLTNVVTTIVVESPEESETAEARKRQIYARATEWIAGLLLHEIASPIGLLAYEASREVPNYSGSRTKAHIVTLQMVFEAIEQLRKASATPRPQQIDLAELVREIVAAEFADFADRIALQGPRPLLLVSDGSLLRFAICNGLRNAIEACPFAPESGISPVVVTWGETDVDYWVSVLDHGLGIIGPVESVLGIGKTTKSGHSGFGLPIATAAIEALGGALSLQSAMGGGAKYELRWEK